MAQDETATQPVTAVSGFELHRYLGLWFEIGRLPLRYEDDDARDVTAEYTLDDDDGSVRVDNRCVDEEGRAVQAVGRAIAEDEDTGRLRVSFLPEGLRWIPFTQADYWVLKLDGAYRHALVGTPDRKHLWLLAREHRVEPDVEAEFLAEARRQGFDLTAWIRPEQTGLRVTDAQLADR